jgi:hypothetical protein
MRLLLVGWDAADWKVIDPLLQRGEMPALAGLIASGVRGNNATICSSGAGSPNARGLPNDKSQI